MQYFTLFLERHSECQLNCISVSVRADVSRRSFCADPGAQEWTCC